MSYSSFGIEKGQLTRQPSTANLMLDSADRNTSVNTSCWDFQITRKQSLINGFFTRIGATEMVLEWGEYNVSTSLDNLEFTVDISGTGGNTFSGPITTELTGGWYTVEDALDEIALKLNASTGTTGTTFSVIAQPTGGAHLDASGGEFLLQNDKIMVQLGFDLGEYYGFNIPENPDLRPYRYIDFVCDKLTAVQDVKDSSTQAYNRDVLLRWYFSEDVPESYDGYGYPILQGYNAFKRRRIYNPPKQIKWEQNIPVGNLPFSVYDPQGELLPTAIYSEWLMTLQLSEG